MQVNLWGGFCCDFMAWSNIAKNCCK